jgi:hypothetical protein
MMIASSLVFLALHVDGGTGVGSAATSAMKDVISSEKAVNGDDSPDIGKLPFTADSIKQVVLSYQPKIQACYEEFIANKKKAPEGAIKSTFIITPEGLVKKAKIDRKGSTLKDAGLGNCVVTVLSTMAFPKPPDGKDHPVEFPFNLKAIP